MPTLIQEAVARPNACLCQNTTGPFVDMGFDRWGEQIYVCHRCVQQIFEVYESVPADVHTRECERLDHASAKVTALSGELEAERETGRTVGAANKLLAERVEELSQERNANEAFVANLQDELKHARNGTKSLEHAKQQVTKRKTATPSKTK